jgi:DNA-directed RNA polymerase subunit N (RpoN/RPB10)
MSARKEFSPLQLEAFPKQCRSCGKVYADEKQFLAETSAAAHVPSDIRSVHDDESEQNVYLEVFRNCTCGSTLMELFHSRRDLSEQGLTRRQLFDSMLNILLEAGHDRQEARAILLQQLPAFKDS